MRDTAARPPQQHGHRAHGAASTMRRSPSTIVQHEQRARPQRERSTAARERHRPRHRRHSITAVARREHSGTVSLAAQRERLAQLHASGRLRRTPTPSPTRERHAAHQHGHGHGFSLERQRSRRSPSPTLQHVNKDTHSRNASNGVLTNDTDPDAGDTKRSPPCSARRIVAHGTIVGAERQQLVHATRRRRGSSAPIPSPIT